LLGVLETTALAVTVPTESAGLLFIDGKLVRKLEPDAMADCDLATTTRQRRQER
jgi:hypothetical protein